jgi:hypothetical protein
MELNMPYHAVAIRSARTEPNAKAIPPGTALAEHETQDTKHPEFQVVI